MFMKYVLDEHKVPIYGEHIGVFQKQYPGLL